jgi:hypothetical protein
MSVYQCRVPSQSDLQAHSVVRCALLSACTFRLASMRALLVDLVVFTKAHATLCAHVLLALRGCAPGCCVCIVLLRSTVHQTLKHCAVLPRCAVWCCAVQPKEMVTAKKHLSGVM